VNGLQWWLIIELVGHTGVWY